MKKTYNPIAIITCLILLATVPAQAATPTNGITADYQPPVDTAGLQIVELLPHSQSCSPVDTSLLCGDYVKLFNSSGVPIDLSLYRLRTSYGGLNTSSSRNTFSLEGGLDSGQYLLINERDDGSPLSLTDSGGYVWLEDAPGVQAYDPVIEYPEAGVDNIGQSWSFNGIDWQWADTPQPDGPNQFPAAEVPDPVSLDQPVQPVPTPIYKPCAPGQTRSAETHRCRKISTAAKKPVSCKAGQIRNPVTRRCRSVQTATKTLTPCKPGQTRNPETHRCRSVLAVTTAKKSCKRGQERNPDTGRCRKIQPQLTAVHDIKTASKTTNQYGYLIAGLLVGAGIYLLYEWRQEVSTGLESFRFKLLAQTRGGESGKITDKED